MPNHVYHHIIFNTTLSSKQKEILKEIETKRQRYLRILPPYARGYPYDYMSYKNRISRPSTMKIMKENEIQIDRSQRTYY
jgi:hypothetical protein